MVDPFYLEWSCMHTVFGLIWLNCWLVYNLSDSLCFLAWQTTLCVALFLDHHFVRYNVSICDENDGCKNKESITASVISLWLTVKMSYSLLSIPGVVPLVFSLCPLTSDYDHAFRLNLPPSLHLLPLPIRSDAGCWLSSLTSCHSSLAWHHLPRTASLTQPVKNSPNCCHSGPALSHDSGPNEEKAEGERDEQRCMYVICVSP